MVGAGITPENIRDAAMYLCGACSCQMKAQNPGIDFLSNIDWYRYLDGSEVIEDKALPPLSGVAALIKSPPSRPTDAAPEIVNQEKPESDRTLATPIMIGAGIMTLLLAFASVVILRKN